MTANVLIWSIIGYTAVVDCLLLGTMHMRLEANHVLIMAVRSTFLLCVWVLYRRRGPAMSAIAATALQVVAGSYVFAILMYLATAASPFPLVDTFFDRADTWLGFNWSSLYYAVNSHQWTVLLLAVAYSSFIPQALFMLGYFAVKDPARVHVFMLAGLLSLAVVAATIFLLPADGSLTYGRVGVEEQWMHDIAALRSGQLRTIGNIEGIAFFPSFHAVLAILLTVLARGRRWFAPVLFINIAMIFSALPIGAHYLADIVAGVVLAFASLAAAEFMLKRCRRPVVAALTQPSSATAPVRG